MYIEGCCHFFLNTFSWIDKTLCSNMLNLTQISGSEKDTYLNDGDVCDHRTNGGSEGKHE